MRADLAGGPLLDLGTYPIALAQWVLGEPDRILATGQPHAAGVNGQAAALLSAPGAEPVHYTEPPVAHDALHFEAAEAGRRVAAGEFESPLRPLADSVATSRAVDEIRRQIGVVF